MHRCKIHYNSVKTNGLANIFGKLEVDAKKSKAVQRRDATCTSPTADRKALNKEKQNVGMKRFGKIFSTGENGAPSQREMTEGAFLLGNSEVEPQEGCEYGAIQCSSSLDHSISWRWVVLCNTGCTAEHGVWRWGKCLVNQREHTYIHAW
ncbi:hypothetical protein TWF694_008935 [Orbilia ellipsospora]|uniref:Uncharacterized protein n=1 Tax=Orbilia ellipsospora TaxID=2528407 RepID=A0AAV9XDD3_9PEZI